MQDVVQKKIQITAGFTLIEIMVVILIIGLLLGVIAPNLLSFLDNGEESRVRQDISNIQTAIKSYTLDNFSPPTEEQGLVALVEKTNLLPEPQKWRRGGYRVYCIK